MNENDENAVFSLVFRRSSRSSLAHGRAEQLQELADQNRMGRPGGGGHELAIDAGVVAVGRGLVPRGAGQNHLGPYRRVSLTAMAADDVGRGEDLAKPWQWAAIGLPAPAIERTISRPDR